MKNKGDVKRFLWEDEDVVLIAKPEDVKKPESIVQKGTKTNG